MLHSLALWNFFCSWHISEGYGRSPAKIPHVTVYIDNILISGETEAAHLQTLEEVLKQLAKAGLRVKLEDGRDRHCHQDQLRKCSVEVSQNSRSEPELVMPTPVISVPSTDSPSSSTTTTEPITQESKPPDPTPIPTTDETVVNPTLQEKTYPKRNHAPVTS